MLLFLRCFVVHRRLRRVRRRRRLAGRAVPGAAAAREGPRLHAGVLVARRPAGRVRQRPVRSTTPPACRRSPAFGIDGIADPHAPWRYTLMSGVIPAIPLILIRPFLPESPVWQQKKAAGTLKRPSIAELFAPALRRTTIVTTLMFAMSYGAAFGAIQQIPQIVPGLPEVRADGAGPAAAAGAADRAAGRRRTSPRCRRSAGSPAASRSPCSRRSSSAGGS